MTLPNRLARFTPGLAIALLVLLVAACGPDAGSSLPPGVTAAPTETPPAGIALVSAQPDNPLGLLSWLFTPIFQVFFITLALFDRATGNIAVAIILMP